MIDPEHGHHRRCNRDHAGNAGTVLPLQGQALLKIARVFPTRTNASPDDALAFFGPPGLFPPEVDAVQVSVAFTWDLPKAESLAAAWRHVAPVQIGGPATGQKAGGFTPGLYLRRGHTITSRGCPNRCWYCRVWQRDGGLRELPIQNGWIVQDDNLLACSREHVEAVFAMLMRQARKPRFPNLEAERLCSWHCEAFCRLKITGRDRLWFAYDEPTDYEPLREAGKLLADAHLLAASRAYCLVGFPKDTLAAAEARLRQCCALGIMPFAMLYRDEKGKRDPDWTRAMRLWCRPAFIRQFMPRPPPDHRHDRPALSASFVLYSFRATRAKRGAVYRSRKGGVA